VATTTTRRLEKFLVIKGTARFRFRHLLTDETVELFTSGDAPPGG
jgi:UDP-2-acetamido-2,6-beta-L-arabino-hexul-4-ose reductase